MKGLANFEPMRARTAVADIQPLALGETIVDLGFESIELRVSDFGQWERFPPACPMVGKS